MAQTPPEVVRQFLANTTLPMIVKSLVAEDFVRSTHGDSSYTAHARHTTCWVSEETERVTTDRLSAGHRPETLECDRADLAYFSHTNQTETKRNRTCEKQNEFGFIMSGRPYFLVVDNWERLFALPTSPFLDNFRVSTILDKFDKCDSGSLLCQATTLNAVWHHF